MLNGTESMDDAFSSDNDTTSIGGVGAGEPWMMGPVVGLSDGVDVGPKVCSEDGRGDRPSEGRGDGPGD